MKKTKKYLITGAAGFVGSHLIDLLLKEQVKPENLRLLILPNESLTNLPDLNFDIFYGDIRNKSVTERLVQDIDIIYHLAAVTRDGEGSYLQTNHIGTKNLVESCKNKKIEKFIFFSTIAVFGLPAFIGDRENIDENDEKMVIGEYAESKYKAEEELKKAHQKWGLPYVIVRPTTVYGPRDKAGIYQLCQVIKSGYFFKIGKGNNKVDYVYVSDVVKGARLAEISDKTEGDYILGAPKPITFNYLTKTVAKSLGVKLQNYYIPYVIALILAYLVDLFGKMGRIKVPISPSRVKVMTANYYFSIQKAQKEIGYRPKVSFKQGIKMTVNWLEKK